MHAPPSLAPTLAFSPITKVIVVLDVVESVRLMERDEQGFIERWTQFVRRARSDILPAHGGRIHKSLGDGMMLEFSEASSALHAAFDLVRSSQQDSRELGADHRIRLRVGAHLARYVADDFDIYGSDVNLTSRLLSLAEPGDIIITSALCERLHGAWLARTQDLGEQRFRHLSQPVRAFKVAAGTEDADSA